MQRRNILLFRMWLRILAVLGLFLVITISFFTWAFWNNLTVRRYEVAAEGLTGRVRVAVLADFHNSSFGAALTDALAEAKPDIVVIPEARRPNFQFDRRGREATGFPSSKPTLVISTTAGSIMKTPGRCLRRSGRHIHATMSRETTSSGRGARTAFWKWCARAA